MTASAALAQTTGADLQDTRPDATRSETPLDALNPAQRAAVVHGDGPLLVLAGAGSGKTRVLTTRIARLINDRGVDPGAILAVTFTNKAAGEMRERLARLLGFSPGGMWVGTFHAIGARLLRANAALAGRSPNFTIYDEDDTLGAVRHAMEATGVSTREWTPKVIAAAISDAKNSLVSPEEYARLASDRLSRAVTSVYPALEASLRSANAATFDDLLVLPVRLLQAHPARRAVYQERFQHILVDEYQDTNRAQYALIRLLGAHGRVTVVGDDDQSIYGWRGADIRNVLEFERDFPSATVVRLEENYRSTSAILDVANAVISVNTRRLGKTLRPTRGAGEPAIVVTTLDERDEAAWVAESIRAERARAADIALRDVAILYRTNAQSRTFEEAFRRTGIPYRLVGAVRFYDRREIRDLMSYLKLIANPTDDEAFRRAIAIPRRGIGDAAITQLLALATDRGLSLLRAAEDPTVLAALRPALRVPLAEFAATLGGLRAAAAESGVDEILRRLTDAIRYGDFLRAEGPDWADRLDNVRELIASAAETVVDEGGEVGLTPLDHFLQRTSLTSATDQLDPNADAVVMMTLHNAKGLEFPVVFITGLEDGLFPLARACENPEQLEEERRLLYVGITRAERTLFLTRAEQRRRNGEPMASLESRFLESIPASMVERRESIAVRSSGRGMLGTGSGGGGAWWRSSTSPAQSARPSIRRPGVPVSVAAPAAQDAAADASQDAPQYRVGERVRHRSFGTGTIVELAGAGSDAKARVDFDDADVGRKTLVIAKAGLQPAFE